MWQRIAQLLSLGAILAGCVEGKEETLNFTERDCLETIDQSVQRRSASGPLRVHPRNPRYFSDSNGSVIYLTGSHNWSNLQDRGVEPIPTFNYAAYLDLIQKANHNFIRLWTWEQAAWAPWTDDKLVFDPLPYLRTGPGTALDGKLKFDLTKFNESYFNRLRSRVAAAGDRGIYVAVMLFEGFSIESKGMKKGNPWTGHPYHGANNINGIDGDPNGDGEGKKVHTLRIPAITALQERYVRKVVDTVNDLDNVLYEISNESGAYSTDWQYHMIRFVKAYEATKPKQHPVGMTFQWGPEEDGLNKTLFDSPADWISPNGEGGYRESPPAADGKKVVLNDTDHLWGVGGTRQWVWHSFLSGLNPIFMDDLPPDSWKDLVRRAIGRRLWREDIRHAMGHTLRFATKMNLGAAVPSPHLCSTKYCLANPGKEYLTYLPEGGMVTMKLNEVPHAYDVEWFNPVAGMCYQRKTAMVGGPNAFTAPFDGEAVLYLRQNTPRDLSVPSR